MSVRPYYKNPQVPSKITKCSVALTRKTMTVDRIRPGAHGGTYIKSNVRPACQPCNSIIGGGNMRKKRRTAF